MCAYLDVNVNLVTVAMLPTGGEVMLKGKEYFFLQRSSPPALLVPAVCSTWLSWWLSSGTQSQRAMAEFPALPALTWCKLVASLGPCPQLHNGAIVLELAFPRLGLCPCTCWYHRVQLFVGSESGSLCARSQSAKTKHSDKFKRGDTYLFPKEREKTLDAFCSFN